MRLLAAGFICEHLRVLNQVGRDSSDTHSKSMIGLRQNESARTSAVKYLRQLQSGPSDTRGCKIDGNSN